MYLCDFFRDKAKTENQRYGVETIESVVMEDGRFSADNLQIRPPLTKMESPTS